MTELAQSNSGTGAPMRWRQSVATIQEPRRQHDKQRAVEDQVRSLVAAAGDISWSDARSRRSERHSPRSKWGSRISRRTTAFSSLVFHPGGSTSSIAQTASPLPKPSPMAKAST